jgi:photosystem II stability/assembly factor-like uncharacterized protein
MTKFVVFACAAIVAAQALSAQSFQWEYLNGPDTTINGYTLHKNVLFAATEKGVYWAADNGNTWSTFASPTDTLANIPVSAVYSYRDTIWAGVYKNVERQGIYLSADNGDTWSMAFKSSRLDPYQPMRYPTRCIASSSSHLFVGMTNGVYRTSNSGKTWKAHSNPPADKVYTLCITDSFLYAGAGQYVDRSKDTGNAWYYAGAPVPKAAVGALHYLGNCRLLAGVSYNDGVYLSTNCGETWRSYSVGITGVKAVSVYCFHAVGQYLFAGSDNGMYYSTNSGERWHQMNDGLLAPTDSTNGEIVWALQAHNGYLFAGTERGVFRTKLPAVGVEEIAPVSEVKIFPNPASESFTVHCPEGVSVAVRDVFGRVRIKNYELGIRNGEATLSTAGYASGVYFVEVVGADGSRVVEKVMVRR